MKAYPEITFSIKTRFRKPWLEKKRQFIEKKWNSNNDGRALLKKITLVCHLPFPKSINSINVSLEPYHGNGGLLGLTDAFGKPNEITLFVKKRHRYSNVKSTLCHELIHSLCWCNTKHDQRRTVTSYFADMFADELLTTLLETYIIKRKMTRTDYEWALDYARDGICRNLKNLKLSNNYQHVVGELEAYLKCYKKEIGNGSNLLLQRQQIVTYIRSPNDC